MKYLFGLLFLFFSCTVLKAQTIHQQAYWFRLYGRVKFKEKWVLHAETDYRRFINPNQMWQNFNQLHLHYVPNTRWDIASALSYAVVWQGTLPVPEWRPYQNIQYTYPLSNNWSLAGRFQFEQRFIHHASKTELTEGFGFRLRPRLRLQVAKTIHSNWVARFSEELFYHLDDGFNQSQTWLSVERKLKNGFSLEMGYLKMIVRRIPSGYFDRDNLRLSLIKNFAVF